MAFLSSKDHWKQSDLWVSECRLGLGLLSLCKRQWEQGFCACLETRHPLGFGESLETLFQVRQHLETPVDPYTWQEAEALRVFLSLSTSSGNLGTFW